MVERRRDEDYPDTAFAPHERQRIRRAADDVDDIGDELRYWQRVRSHVWGIAKWMLGLPVAIAALWHAVQTIISAVWH